MQTQERRHTSRISLPSKGYAMLGNRDIDLTAHNISLGGSLVEFAAPLNLSKGMAIRVSLDLGFKGQAIICHAATGDASVYGLKFDLFDHASHLMLGSHLLNYREPGKTGGTGQGRSDDNLMKNSCPQITQINAD